MHMSTDSLLVGEVWLATVMGADAGVRPHEANQMISDAVDLLVQIGIRNEVRRVVAISKIAKDLKNGDVFFDSVYRYVEEFSAMEPHWEELSENFC
ncbi:MAG: hypothetical protein JEZ00_11445 [Anaerolineaceae bacterium]|nr:hypothetical protein [Anaerolineaceae bacterium]